MQRRGCDGFQDQQVQRALHEIDRFAHSLSPLDGRQEDSAALVDRQGEEKTGSAQPHVAGEDACVERVRATAEPVQ